MPSTRDCSFSVSDVDAFKEKLLLNASTFNNYCLLNSNRFTAQNIFHDGESVDWLLATGSTDAIVTEYNAWEELKVFFNRNRDKWIFGHLTYDLKNQVENLFSKNPDKIGFPLIHFFVPQSFIKIKDAEVIISSESDSEAEKIFNSVNNTVLPEKKLPGMKFKNKVTKEEYLENVHQIIKHIRYGDVYELNYCIEFFAEEVNLNPEELYFELNKYSPAPFSALYKLNNRYLISASPERFLAKRGNRIFSQPIKGTIKKGKTESEDLLFKKQLQNDPKERSENIMIVDLVRNDLSRSCEAGSVKVDELCGIYSFPHVHQMISTVSGELKEDVHPVDAIKNAFPMGSMTGAPKVRAMELIEKYESTKRGLYSGSVGYFDPDGNFDFNVVIRSFQYNLQEKYISVMAGSAITALSNPEKEYEECLLKAEALKKMLE